MSLAFRVCPRCGCRNATRHGDTLVGPDYCVRCDPRPKDAVGFHVLVHGLCHSVGEPPVHYRLRIVDPNGEVVFSKEPMGRDEARELALQISENIIAFLESRGM